MGIFTKKNTKRKSDEVDGIPDAWLIGEDDGGNVGLDRLEYLEDVVPNPSPSPDELASAPPPSPAAGDDAAEDQSSDQGWHLPDMAEPTAEEVPHVRRADDEQVVTFQPPVAPVPISEFEARADFLAVDIPDVAEVPIRIPDIPSLPLSEPPMAEPSSLEFPTLEATPIEQVPFETTDLQAPTIELPSSISSVSSEVSTGPTGPQADTLLEIIGLAPGSTWAEIRDAHQNLMQDHDESAETDPSRIALGRAIKREMNTAYAALRLMAVD